MLIFCFLLLERAFMLDCKPPMSLEYCKQQEEAQKQQQSMVNYLFDWCVKNYPYPNEPGKRVSMQTQNVWKAGQNVNIMPVREEVLKDSLLSQSLGSEYYGYCKPIIGQVELEVSKRYVDSYSQPKGVLNKLGGFLGSIGIGIPLSADDEVPETQDISEEDLMTLYDMLNEDEREAVNDFGSRPIKFIGPPPFDPNRYFKL